MARILVTGGAGYIGSTTSKLLQALGHEVSVYDNLSTGHRDFARFGELIVGDIRDTETLKRVMTSKGIEAVVHFAAKAYVGESVGDPALYYDNNVVGTLSLLRAMVASGLSRIVVSSTCAVYGQPATIPITEFTPLNPINPYGASKAMMERMCADFSGAHGIKAVALRYFNACGTEEALEVGERHDPEPHVIPRILMAADGELEYFDVLGSDYVTPDGTCIRDYIHVSDLARAHGSAVQWLLDGNESLTCNLGTGKGSSVAQLIDVAKRTTNREIKLKVAARRPGDPAELVADPSLAWRMLGWKATESDLENIMKSAWAWRRKEVM